MLRIEVSTFGGFDWHDQTMTSRYLTENGNPDIKHPSKVIAAHLHKTLVDMEISSKAQDGTETRTKLENIPSVSEIETYITNGKSFTVSSEDGYELEAVWRPEKNQLDQYFMAGQVWYDTTYTVENIADENVWYFVTESFLCPEKGVPCVNRFYQRPFTNMAEARKAMDELKLHEELASDKGIVKEMLILDKTTITERDWYKTNMEVVEFLENHPELDTAENFRMYVAAHLEHLKNCA